MRFFVMTSDTRSDLEVKADGCYARWSYERLLLLQPQLAVDGLWALGALGEVFCIVCPDLTDDTLASNGEPIGKWFNEEGKAMGSPVGLVAKPPEGALRVPERKITDRVNLIGAPLSVRSIVSILSVSLPRDLPPFDFKTSPPVASLYVPRSLSDEEEIAFRDALDPYLGRLHLDIVINKEHFTSELGFRFPSFIQGDIDLVPARRLPRSLAKSVKNLVEEDEDNWVAHRQNLFASESYMVDLPNAFGVDTSKCLIDASVFPPRNLRMAVSMYGQVQIAMPVASAYSSALEGFQVSEDDLVALAERDRVTFVLPQSIDRYPLSLVQKLAEVRPDSLLMSRHLAALMVQERKRRLPLLHAPFSISERRSILSSLKNVSEQKYQKLCRTLASEFGSVWASTEDSVAFRGAMGLYATGIGQMVAAMVQAFTGRELRLEMWTAGASVEWASIFGSTVIPVDGKEYSEQKITEMLASAYSGVKNQSIPANIGDMELAVNGLLAINNDAPILDLEQAFSGGDVNRMRSLVLSLSGGEGAISEVVEAFNDRISRYERNQNRLERLDLLGLVGVIAPVASAAAGHVDVGAYIPISMWIANYLLKNSDLRTDPGGRLAESLRALNSFVPRDVVMVSRLRKSMAQ